MLKSKITVSEPELVYDSDQMKFAVDGSCCTLRRADGRIDFLTTACGDGKANCLHFVGTAENPFDEELEDFEWDYNNYRTAFPSGLWVQSFYKCEDGMLIGFTHREDLSKDLDYPQSYHVGFSVSYDNGQHWKYLGDVLGTCCNYISKNRCGGKFPNVGGVPFFAGKDGYFYFYFNEHNQNYERYVSGARLPIKETIESVRRGEAPASLVKKYSGNGVWDTEPKFGVAARMLPENLEDVRFIEEIGYKYDCHSDAAYCSALDKYVLIVQSARQVIMFLSDDGASWNDHRVLFNAEPDIGLCYYSTIVGLDDEASDDFSTIGSDFYVYFTHKPKFVRLPGNYGYYLEDKFYRCRVTIE